MYSLFHNLLKLLLIFSLFIIGICTSEIDFSQIPNCTYPACFPYHSSAIGCPSLTKECFCNALTPINCASQSCDGSNWYALEDWFDTQCPNPPTVDFSEMPLCSRACIRDNIIPTYCNTTITRNCFCRIQSEFESFSPCVQNNCGVTADEAVNIATKFYNDTCIHPPTSDGSTTSSTSSGQQTADEVANAPSGGSTPDTPENKLSEIIGIASGFGTLIGFVLTFLAWLYRKRRKSNRPGRPALDDLLSPPPRYTPY